MKIDGSGVVVTGGALGLGLAAAPALRDEGTTVGVLDFLSGWLGPGVRNGQCRR